MSPRYDASRIVAGGMPRDPATGSRMMTACLPARERIGVGGCGSGELAVAGAVRVYPVPVVLYAQSGAPGDVHVAVLVNGGDARPVGRSRGVDLHIQADRFGIRHVLWVVSLVKATPAR